MPHRVSPTERIHGQIDELFASGKQLPEILEQVARLGAQLLMQAALEAEILVLDDLGAHRVTDWVEDTVTSIVTHRCNNRKATIVTSNLRDPEAGDQRGSGLQEDIHSKYFLEERIGMRARSRLFEMCRLIKMPLVEDYRLRRR